MAKSLCPSVVIWACCWYEFTYIYYNNPDDTECFADLKNSDVNGMELNSSMVDVSGQFKSWIFVGHLIFTAMPFFVVMVTFMQMITIKSGKNPIYHPTYGRLFCLISAISLI